MFLLLALLGGGGVNWEALPLESFNFLLGLSSAAPFPLLPGRGSAGYNEGRKEMFYLTTHSTHFIYGYMASDMVKDHSDSEKENPLPPHMLLFPINSKGSFIPTIPRSRLK